VLEIGVSTPIAVFHTSLQVERVDLNSYGIRKIPNAKVAGWVSPGQGLFTICGEKDTFVVSPR